MIMDAFRECTPKSAHPDVGNTWYVAFGTGEDAAAALETEITIEGSPIRGCLKSEASNVPNMPLPPTAQAPNANMMSYHHYPMQPTPPYGLLPIHYGMPPPMTQQSYRMQPPYYPQPQYRYFAPPNQRHSGMPPPQNVFVRPNPVSNNNGSGNSQGSTNIINNNNKRRSNNQNKKKNRNRQQQAKEQSVPENINRKQNNETNKKQSKNNRSKKRSSPRNLDLSNEHFPALGGKESPMPPTTTTKVEGSAYAKALLKSAKKKEQNPKSSDTADLETSMNELAFSSDAVATPSYEEW
jgi:hypothetical protein